VPRVENYQVEETSGMTLFLALDRDPRYAGAVVAGRFRLSRGICGSCGMIINGRPGLACRTLTKDLPDEISLRHCRASS
jgi:fumarate reductase iron-sulfur subunit